MTWQVGTLTILALALAGGFAWYERTKPDARIVALVGTLAAFAALGRIAFAALPNVKPTTDIVLVSGYALGGAPGFVVGAVAGLTSNFFFGQGPWTPWQMAAWGMTGLIGAGLAWLCGRRLNRLVLAVICAAVGFAFTAFQDVGDWVMYSDHSLSALGVYVGKGVGFDLVHAGGCVAFALAFGPALARSIARFATRLNVTWDPPGGVGAPARTRTRGGVIAPAVVALAASLAWLAGQPGQGAGAATPAGYLLSAQNADGGFGPSPGATSTPLYSGWAALGLAAAGYNPQSVRHGGQSLIGYIESHPPSDGDPGSIERTILVLRATGLPAGGLVSELERQIRRDGSVSNQVNLTSFGILALRAAGVSPPAAMTAWLARQQDSDGGFNFAARGPASDVDDTGAALEALGGGDGRVTARALAFIEHQKNPDGGYPSLPGEGSNAQSTAWAVQGLLAAGVPVGSLGRPLSYLRSLIAADGHVRYSAGGDQTPVWVTAEALMALEGKPLPLAPLSAPPPVVRPPSEAGRRHPATRARSGSPPLPRRAASGTPAPSLAPLRRMAIELGVLDALVLAPVR